MREVRKRTQINNLLHGKGNCCVPSGHARHSKNPMCLPDSEDGLVQLLIVLLPVIFILIFFFCLSVLKSLLIFEFQTNALLFLWRRLALFERLILRHCKKMLSSQEFHLFLLISKEIRKLLHRRLKHSMQWKLDFIWWKSVRWTCRVRTIVPFARPKCCFSLLKTFLHPLWSSHVKSTWNSLLHHLRRKARSLCICDLSEPILVHHSFIRFHIIHIAQNVLNQCAAKRRASNHLNIVSVRVNSMRDIGECLRNRYIFTLRDSRRDRCNLWLRLLFCHGCQSWCTWWRRTYWWHTLCWSRWRRHRTNNWHSAGRRLRIGIRIFLPNLWIHIRRGMHTWTPSWKPMPLCWKWNQPDQTWIEWQHSKIRSMKLDMQDLLVRSAAAHITSQICERRCCASSPSLLSLTPSATEEDGWANIRRRKECKWQTPTAMHIIPDEKIAVVICLGQQMLESPNDIMREDLLSSGSNRRGIAIKTVWLKSMFPRKIVAVLPSIQGNFLSRDAAHSLCGTALVSWIRTRMRASES